MSDFSGRIEPLPLDAVLIAVRVGEERGGAALLSGGSGDARRALTERIAEALAREGASAAPLWVEVRPRLSAPGARAEGPLLDDIVAAVEQRLSAVHAPGGLYDSPGGGPLASLGGWLFRARAVGYRGIALCVPEVDAWLDARGAAQPAPGDARNLDVLAAALGECAQRQLSVLVSVRAADASGTPCLPGELLERFARVEHLGGATTLTRDPRVLVAALAGRSFTLPALKNALAGWLELTDASDQTVVVFTAPGDAVAEPARADAAGELRDEAPPASAPAAAQIDPELRPESAADPDLDAPRTERRGAATTPSAPRVLVSSQAAGPVAPESWSRAVRAAVEAREALRVLRELGPVQGFRQYERAYRDGISRLPLALAALERGERALGIEATRLQTEGRAALARFAQGFGEFYPAAFDAWMAGAARPAMLCDVPGMMSRAAAEHGARGTQLVLFTGLRLDAWRRLRERVLPEVPGLEVLSESLLWAARPTTPATQRELLVRGLAALRGPLPRRDELPAPRSLEEALRPRRENLGHVEVLRVDGYAIELARATAALPDALEHLEAALPAALRALTRSLPRRTIVAITGDVGMRELTRRDDEKEHPRFGYGGDSPFEAVVPYAMLSWAAGPLHHG